MYSSIVLMAVTLLPLVPPEPPEPQEPQEIQVDVGYQNWVPVPVPMPAQALGYGVHLDPALGADSPRSSATLTKRTNDGKRVRRLTVRSGGPAGGSATVEVIEPGPRWPAGLKNAVERLTVRPDADTAMREGAALFAAREFAKAAARFRRAIPLDPDNGLPRLQHAHALFALADYEGAAYDLRRGTDLLPVWIDSGNDLASLYSSAQDLSDHVASLRAHLRQEASDADAWLVLSYVQLFTGHHDDAAASVSRLLELDPRGALGARLAQEISRRRGR